MIEIFTFRLEANEAREAAVTGAYFEIRNAPSSIALIELLDRTGAVVSRLSNPEQSDFVKPGVFQTVRVTNGPAAQTVRLFVGTGDAGSRRTSGLVTIDGTSNVAVIDGGKLRTERFAGFMGYAFSEAFAPTFSQVTLFNPAGSGKNVFVSQLTTISTGNALIGFNLSLTNAAIGALYVTQASNKRAGGPPGLTEFRHSSIPTINNRFAVLSKGQPTFEFQEPVMLPPGWGISVQNQVINETAGCSFEYFEEPV